MTSLGVGTEDSSAAGRIARLAAALCEARLTGQAIDATPDNGPTSLAEAFAVQRAVWQRLVGDMSGDDAPPRAWKVGAAGCDAPLLAGRVLPDAFARSPAAFPGKNFFRVGVEAEIAFVFRDALPVRDAPWPREAIAGAIGSAHVAMEIVDTRLRDPDAAGTFWKVADNLVNGTLTLGDEIRDWQRVDWPTLTARSWIEGTEVACAQGQVPLGDVLHLLPAWIRHIGGVRPGDVVTTGTWNGVCWAKPPATLRVGFDGLGVAETKISSPGRD